MAMEIIPGLPDDIGRECLLRVPLTSHYKLVRVCKTWKHVVYNALFYQDRKRFGWSYCVPFNHKLFVIGLLSDNFPSALVIYDFSSGKWKCGPNIPDNRECSCCSVDSAKGLIYIAGRCYSRGEELRTAIVYDTEEEKWEYLPQMIWSEDSDMWHSVFSDDKFYVVSHAMGQIQIYDPNTRQWSAITIISDVCMYPSFSAFGWIYHDFHEKIVEWDYLENQCLHVPDNGFIGATVWNKQMLMAVEGEENSRDFYLSEPSIPEEAGKAEENNWTLLSSLSETELPDVITIGALTL
ncbi:hypothetical protein SUGI_0224790 [Cryptomeria japonica]|nr:hypothetical protein SUGI_0224790 [Cryptomeria japonica]